MEKDSTDERKKVIICMQFMTITVDLTDRTDILYAFPLRAAKKQRLQKATIMY